jgi:16S rRNA processing protein RimM
MPSPRLLVGIIGAPHGVRGEVRVKAYTSDLTALKRYGELQNEGGTRTFTVLALRALKDDMCVVRFKEAGDRDAAAELTHTKLYALRANMPATAEGEYYHADLIGLRAETRAGACIGTVLAVQNFGAGDLLEIAPENSGETLLLPFTDAVAPIVDLAGSRIVIEPPREIDGEDRATDET